MALNMQEDHEVQKVKLDLLDRKVMKEHLVNVVSTQSLVCTLMIVLLNNPIKRIS